MIKAIVATDPFGLIGFQQEEHFGLPWRYPADMVRFRKLTTDHVLLMGGNTYRSLSRALPHRQHVVVSRREAPEGTFADAWEHTPERALQRACELAGKIRTVWIIGGAEVYTWAIANKIPDVVDVTLVPPVTKNPADSRRIVFPVDLLRANYLFEHQQTNEQDSSLTHQRWARSA